MADSGATVSGFTPNIRWNGHMTEEEANKQQEAIKKIMADRKVPFEQAVDIYIKRQHNAV